MSVFWDGYVHGMDAVIAENIGNSTFLIYKRIAMKQKVTALSENFCGEMSAREAGAGIRILFL